MKTAASAALPKISPEIPACFDSAELYQEWVELARHVSERHEDGSPAHYCNDCLPAHQAAMIAQRRCRSPEVIFIQCKDGGIAGVTQTDPKWVRLVEFHVLGLARVGYRLKGKPVGVPTADVVRPIWLALQAKRAGAV
jgi:hypothetical protein